MQRLLTVEILGLDLSPCGNHGPTPRVSESRAGVGPENSFSCCVLAAGSWPGEGWSGVGHNMSTTIGFVFLWALFTFVTGWVFKVLWLGTRG